MPGNHMRDKIRKGKRKQANGQPEYSRSIPVLLQGLLCLSLLSFAEDTQKTTWTWDIRLSKTLFNQMQNILFHTQD